MRRATRHIKLDANHAGIVRELRRRGVEVVELFEPVDLFCRIGAAWAFCEIKVPGSRAAFTRAQLTWIAATRMPVIVATDADQVIERLRGGGVVGQKQKDALAAFLLREPASVRQWHPAAVKGMVG